MAQTPKTPAELEASLPEAERMKYYYYEYLTTLPLDEHAILFESFHGKTVSDSPLHMLQELMRQGRAQDFTIYFSSADPVEHQQVVEALGLPVNLVEISTREYMRVLATAKYLVNNSSFPASFMRREGQVYLQTFHGTPLKTLGKRMRLGIESMYNVQHNFLQASMITFPNEFTRASIMRDYNLEDLYCGQVAMLGFPRNDVFLRNDGSAQRIRQELGLEGVECFAYMPTWRGTSNHDVVIGEYQAQVNVIFEKLDAALRDDQRVFVNFHSMVANEISLASYKHIQAFPEGIESYAFLNAMDALITDYSSVFFDFSLTRKPVVLFIYDLEEYLHDRGLYLEIESLPFLKARTTEELCSMLASGSYAKPTYQDTQYEADYLPFDSEKNSQQALDLLLKGEADGVFIEDYSRNLQREWKVLDPPGQKGVEDVRSMCLVASQDPKHTLVAFGKSAFRQDMSIFLHDNYRDAFNYIFFTRSVPRSWEEELASKTDSSVSKALYERDLRRMFGSLKIGSVEREHFTGQTGTSFKVVKRPRLNAQVSCDGRVLRIQLDREAAQSYELNGFFAALDRTIIWARQLTADELETLCITDSLRGIMLPGGTGVGDKVGLYLDARDLQSGRRLPVGIQAPDRPNARPDDMMSSCFAAIRHSMEGFSAEECRGSNYLSRVRHLGFDPMVLPYQSSATPTVRVKLGTNESCIRYAMKVTLTQLQVGRSGKVKLQATYPANGAVVTGAALRLRSSVESLEYELPFTLSQEGAQMVLDIRFNAAQLKLRESYWDFVVYLESEGLCGTSGLMLSDEVADYIVHDDVESRLDGGMIFFPYKRVVGTLGWLCRPATQYDSRLAYFKERLALRRYRKQSAQLKARRIWLIYEKYCSTAQDNGFYFFKYCMEELPPERKRDIFFVLTPDSKDRANVEPYKENVLDFMSIDHIVYAMAAKIYVASDSRAHLYTWQNKPSLVKDRIMQKRILFLQHGVTACKRVDSIFGKKGTNPMTYFLCTSAPEQRIVMDYFGYDADSAPVLGFSRWDVLEDRSTPQEPSILMMPTWRSWLEEHSDDAFEESDYFKAYSAFIQSPLLLEFLERHNARLRFYIHPKLSEHLSSFASNNPRVELVAQGSRPLNELIMESSAMITDYSSVCWDELYMNKPVVFYQFDQKLYLQTTGSYIDFNAELPGDVCLSLDQTVEALERAAQRGFKLSEEAQRRAAKWYPNRDRNNRLRTLEFIDSKKLK